MMQWLEDRSVARAARWAQVGGGALPHFALLPYPPVPARWNTDGQTRNAEDAARYRRERRIYERIDTVRNRVDAYVAYRFLICYGFPSYAEALALAVSKARFLPRRMAARWRRLAKALAA